MLDPAIAFLREEVRPKAELLDHDPQPLKDCLFELGSFGVLALKRPMAYGGPELGEGEFRRFQEEVARASGALAFLQTQHQSAVSILSKGSNEDLKAELLHRTHDGSLLIGVGFSQLRRSGEPLLKAKRVDSGYQVDGHIPWATGAGIFDLCMIGAALDTGESLFGMIPFANQKGIQISEPMRLAAMESAQTVTLDLHELFIPDSQIVNIKPGNWIHKNDLINIVLQGFFAIGCAAAGLDIAFDAIAKKPNPENEASLESLSSEIALCREKLFAAQAQSDETTEEKLNLRAWAIELAVRCAHAAIASVGGSANELNHPAQRVYREALVYTVSAQTSAIQQATLKIISRR